MKKTYLYGFGDTENIEPVETRKYEILQRVTATSVAPLVSHYDLQVFLGLEGKNPIDSLYKSGRWGMGLIDLSKNIARIIFSRESITELSDLAFEGLVYHEVTEAFMGKVLSRTHPKFMKDDIDGKVPYAKKEAMVDILTKQFFNTNSLVPFRIETANIDYRNGFLEMEYYRQYLDELKKIIPEVELKIREGLIFKNKIKKSKSNHK